MNDALAYVAIDRVCSGSFCGNSFKQIMHKSVSSSDDDDVGAGLARLAGRFACLCVVVVVAAGVDQACMWDRRERKEENRRELVIVVAQIQTEESRCLNRICPQGDRCQVCGVTGAVK